MMNSTFQCGECDLAFPEAAMLANHMKCHIEVHLVRCNGCSKYFLQAPDVEDYTCTNCKTSTLIWEVNIGQTVGTDEDIPSENCSGNVSHIEDLSEESAALQAGETESADESVNCRDIIEVHVNYEEMNDRNVKSESVSKERESKQGFQQCLDFPVNAKADEVEESSVDDDDDDHHHHTQISLLKANNYSSGITRSICDLTDYPGEHLNISVKQTVKVKPAVSETVPRDLFKCIACGARFDDYESIKTHLKTHKVRLEKPYGCGECDAKFRLATDLKQHFTKHTGVEDFECELCHNTFTRKQSLNRHMKIHRGIKPFMCSFCNMRFLEHPKLVLHERTHTGEKPYSCDFCDMRFSGIGGKNTHAAVHKDKEFHCSLCGKSFHRPVQLREHEKLHLPEKPHECEVCKKRFYQKRTYQNHMKLHNEEKPFQCKTCGFCCSSPTTLSYHRRKHDTVRAFEKCDIEMFNKMHEEFLDPQIRRENQCKFCWQEFDSAEKREEHMKVHSDKAKPYWCETCCKSFKGVAQYKHHLKQQHCQCWICGKIFNDLKAYKSHMKTHAHGNEAKAIICKLCKLPCSHKSRLLIHRKCHTNEKPYQCSHCGEMYKTLLSLREHSLLHTGPEKCNFICDICGKAFMTKNKCAAHLKLHKLSPKNQSSSSS